MDVMGVPPKGFPPYVPQDVMFQFMGTPKKQTSFLETLLRVSLWGARLGLGTHPETNMVCKDLLYAFRPLSFERRLVVHHEVPVCGSGHICRRKASRSVAEAHHTRADQSCNIVRELWTASLNPAA